MTWTKKLTPAELYQRHLRDFAEALRTWSADELAKGKKDLQARLRQLEAGTAKRDPVFGANEEAELARMIDRVTERVAYLGRVADGGVDLGREAAEKGTGPLHLRLREEYAELDRLEADGGKVHDVLERIAHLKKVLAEGDELGPPTVPEEVLERKRAETRYSSI